MKKLLIVLLIITSPIHAEIFSTSSMPISEVVRNVADIYKDHVVYQSSRKDLIQFEIKDNEKREDVYLKLAMLLVEYGIEFVEENNTIYFRDFNDDLPQLDTEQTINTSRLTTFRYKVKNSDSAKFANSVASIFTEGEKIADTGLNNTVIVTVYSQRQKEVKSLLRSLDKKKIDFVQRHDRIIQIDHVQPQKLASLIASAFGTKYKYSLNADNTKLYINISDEDNQRLRQLLKQFDKKKRQVLVDVIIAEMTTGRATELGRQLAYSGATLQGVVKYPSLNNVLGEGISALSTGLVLSFVKDKFSFILENIKTDASTNILSTPSLMTKEGYQASLIVGQSVPFKTGSYTSTGNGSTPENPFTTIERHDVGIKLQFTPRILSDNAIDLALNQELSSVAQSSTGASDLITNKRQLKTNVIVENNDIIVLGGLVETSRSNTESSSPALRKIPLLGKLFRKQSVDYYSTNLMIFIRPRILTADSRYNRQLVQKYIGSHPVNFQLKAKNTKKIARVENSTLNKKTNRKSSFEDFF